MYSNLDMVVQIITGVSTLATPTLFYSRRIGRVPQGSVTTEGFVDYPRETRILGAAKITGKLNESWSLGVLSSVTERTYATIQSDETGNMVKVKKLNR